MLEKKSFKGTFVQGQAHIIRCISDLRQPCISKTDGRTVKRMKTFNLHGEYIECMQGTFYS